MLGGSGRGKIFPRVRGHLFIAGLNGERETILFPDDPAFSPENTIWSAKTRFYTLRPARNVSADGLYFVASATGHRSPGALPAAQATADANKSHDGFLFRWRGGDALDLVRGTPVVAMDAQRSGGRYVVVTRVPPGFNSSPLDFHVVRKGVAEPRLRFELVGTVFAVSVSERLDTIAFSSFRNSGEQVRFWVHREGWAQAVDLNIAERVRREVEFQSQREANEATAGQEPPRATPTPWRPAAAPR